MYRIQEEEFGAHKKLLIHGDEVKFEVSLTGATPLSLQFLQGESFISILDGYMNHTEFDSGNGSRNWIMTPFANRIANDTYSFQNKKYHLKPIPPKSRVIHGFTSMEPFTVESITQSKEDVTILLKNSSIRKDVFEGYPFDVDVSIQFILNSTQLSIEVIGENLSDVPIPFWSGWHPYFRTSNEGIEELKLKLDASSLILMDNNFIPLEGKDAYADINQFPDFNLNTHANRNGKIINGKIFDLCYSGLTPEADGNLSTYITDEKNDIKLRVFQDKGVTLIFSGDSLLERKRKSIAVEPMQCLTNAFNRKEFEDEITINPGEAKSFHFGVTFIKEEKSKI